MSLGPLISAEALAASAYPICLLDCRAGADAYASGHLEGALHADLDRHLSTASEPGFDPARGGRHPLPDPGGFAAQLGAWGIDPDMQVVAYDRGFGADGACRLWWMLRALGHEHVAVLNGGLVVAREAGLPLTSAASAPPRTLPPYPCDDWGRPIVDLETVERRLQDPAWKVLDVRARRRWLGEVEPLDPIPGRIPGASNLPFSENLDADGRFEQPEVQRTMYLELLGGTRPDHLVVYCGSGVTACHTLLALELAGLDGASLYAGSYSEWCRSGRPIARG